MSEVVKKKSNIAKVTQQALETFKRYELAEKIKDFRPIYNDKDIQLLYVKTQFRGYYMCRVKDAVCIFCKDKLNEEGFCIIATDINNTVKCVVLACNDCVAQLDKNPKFIWTRYFNADFVHEYPVKVKHV